MNCIYELDFGVYQLGVYFLHACFCRFIHFGTREAKVYGDGNISRIDYKRLGHKLIRERATAYEITGGICFFPISIRTRSIPLVLSCGLQGFFWSVSDRMQKKEEILIQSEALPSSFMHSFMQRIAQLRPFHIPTDQSQLWGLGGPMRKYISGPFFTPTLISNWKIQCW